MDPASAPSNPDSPPASNPDSFVVQWCQTESDYQALEAITFFQRGDQGGENQALKGCQAMVNDELAGGIWAITNGFTESELGICYRLSAAQIWLFAARVDKRFRRRGVYAEILKSVLPAVAELGFSQPLVAVNPDNKASNAVHRRHAVGSPGTVLAIRFLTLTVCWTSGQIQTDRWLTLNAKRAPIELTIRAAD